MSAIAGDPPLPGSPLTWSLLFARQPEPDLEFTEEELEQTTTIRSSSPMKPPKKSGGRSLLWVLLLVLIGGGAYVAMEQPELVTEYLGPLLGESPAPEPEPPVARKPAAPKPVPAAPIAQPPAATSTPAPSASPVEVAPTEGPRASTPTPAPVLTPASPPSMPTASAPEPAPLAPAPTPVTPVTASSDPLFSEGQRVSVVPNPAAPGEKVFLHQDAEGTKRGLGIPPGTVLTILDGDLQNNGWVYSVRSDYGTKGWLAEKQLKLKP